MLRTLLATPNVRCKARVGTFRGRPPLRRAHLVAGACEGLHLATPLFAKGAKAVHQQHSRAVVPSRRAILPELACLLNLGTSYDHEN